MKNDIEKLKERFRSAKTQKEFDEIEKEMSALAEKPKEFSQGMLESIKDTNREVSDILLRKKLEDVLPAISVSYLSKTYFQKTPQWFYQRLNRNIVNGKEAEFTNSELKTLANALNDISSKIQKSVALVV